MRSEQPCAHFALLRRNHHKARLKDTRPTAKPGTKVTTRLPSGVAHDTTPEVTKPATRPMMTVVTGVVRCEGALGGGEAIAVCQAVDGWTE
ncbi:hypothetical protein [Methylosarcina fibrata]|uniref:hypothetical protein n=1 Tax=Methylosarcina fibrata TaxID=105972 RepID=UPI001E41A3E1|nr:hypothetical protein [Methylosarcina fibrata]